VGIRGVDLSVTARFCVVAVKIESYRLSLPMQSRFLDLLGKGFRYIISAHYLG
jgi:hypothetical protein